MGDSRGRALDRFAAVAGGNAEDRVGVRTRSTRDHDAIRRWAAAHGAAPATGEATSSGPATVVVNDGCTGIRFNFPGIARFRPIEWDEWLTHFDAPRLRFVYEEQDINHVALRANELFRARGAQDGFREDWFRAEHELQAHTRGAPLRYRIVKDDTASDASRSGVRALCCSPDVVQYGPNTGENERAGPTRNQHETTRVRTSLNLQNLHPRFKSGRRLQS